MAQNPSQDGREQKVAAWCVAISNKGKVWQIMDTVLLWWLQYFMLGKKLKINSTYRCTYMTPGTGSSNCKNYKAQGIRHTTTGVWLKPRWSWPKLDKTRTRSKPKLSMPQAENITWAEIRNRNTLDTRLLVGPIGHWVALSTSNSTLYISVSGEGNEDMHQ